MNDRTALDSSVLVAALASWHESHGVCVGAVEELLSRPGTIVLPADALVETYAVLTRLPAPHRLSPRNAWELLHGNFGKIRPVELGSGDVWNFLRGQMERSVAGGAVYDARIIAAAVKGGALRLLTLNARHFERLAPEGLEISVPGR